MSFYSQIADYYDLIFPPSKAHVDFVKSCVKPPYPGKKILDIGSGTGDLAISLSHEGFVVTGIDFDADMLAKAAGKVREGSPITFSCMDMREKSSRFSPSTFDGALSFGNTLVHLTDLQEIAVFCKDVRTILNAEGVFLLQILNYNHILDHNVTELPPIENDTIRFDRHYKYDAATNLIAFKTILIIKETGTRIENEIPLYPIRKQELETALKAAGFIHISWYADFNKGELKPDSLPLVVEAG
jgi:glycine/sarcosine N-methyltransferase